MFDGMPFWNILLIVVILGSGAVVVLAFYWSLVKALYEDLTDKGWTRWAAAPVATLAAPVILGVAGFVFSLGTGFTPWV